MPESFQVNYEGTNYWIYVSSEASLAVIWDIWQKNCPQAATKSAIPRNAFPFNEAISFTKPIGTKRNHSATTCESPVEESIAVKQPQGAPSDIVYETEVIDKRKRKITKTEDKINEKEVWNDIEMDINENNLSPLSIDQFSVRSKHSIKDIVEI